MGTITWIYEPRPATTTGYRVARGGRLDYALGCRVEVGLSRLTPDGWVHQHLPPTPYAEVLAETAPERLLGDLSPERIPVIPA